MEEIQRLITTATASDADIETKHRAFGVIVKRFQDMAFATAYAVLGDFQLAQDAAQEAFIAAYRNLAKLKDPEAFPGWFRRIVVGESQRLIRRKHLPTAPLETALGVASDEKGPAAQAQENEMKAAVHSAIETLPENQRLVTTLFYINEYCHKQIADFLEIPIKTVDNRLRAARKRLKARMITMVQDTLTQQRPSHDEQFVREVLFKAVEEADREKISQLLDEDPTLIDAKDAKGHTPLHIAVFSEDPPMVELLVERGANLRRADRDWNATPLETAHNMFLRVQNSGREAIYSYLLNLHDDSLQSQTELGIHITGAVHEPGDYRLGGDARLADAIFAAGGPSQNADTHLLKYDAKLRDGQQIFIPQISAGTGAKKLLLFEGFDNDTIDDNVWQGFSPDKLVARNGFLDFNGALKQRKFIYTHDSTFSDVEMFSDFKILVFTIAFRLRLQDPEHCYGVQYDLRDPTSIEFVTFLNGPNDAKRTYIETERIPEKFEWQRMKVEVKGFTFKAYLGHHDGDLHHVATWEDPDKTYRTGAIGFRVDGSEHTQFDNVMVTTL